MVVKQCVRSFPHPLDCCFLTADATIRFASIDKEVKEVLKGFKETKNAVGCCSKEGLMKFLEKQQGQLEICEKALADYMESKRRAFPRFYFVSTADLLDILSNGNSPTRVMMHMSKCFQAIEKLKLDNESPPPGVRPKALGMESCVGIEYLAWKTPLPLEGKVRARAQLASLCEYPRSDTKDPVCDVGSIFDLPSQFHTFTLSPPPCAG